MDEAAAKLLSEKSCDSLVFHKRAVRKDHAGLSPFRALDYRVFTFTVTAENAGTVTLPSNGFVSRTSFTASGSS